MKSSEITGTHQEPTQLWQELHALGLVASRLLAALLERNLREDQRRAIQQDLEALAEFIDATPVPQDLDTFDEILQKRLTTLESAVINSRIAINNRRKRFPRLRRMLTKLSKRD